MLKRTLLATIIIATGYVSKAQNTFPSSGNVGIGTTNTGNAALTVNQNTVSQIRLENDALGEEAGIRWRSRNSSGSYIHGDLSLYYPASNPAFLGFKIPHNNTPGGGYQMVVNTNGQVGIGTTSPFEKLSVIDGDLFIGRNTVNQPESGRIRFSEYTNNYQGGFIHYNGDANILNLGVHNVADANSSGDNNVISIKRSNGFVGIGNTSPEGKLDIIAGSTYPIRTSTSQRYVVEVKNTNDTNGGWWLVNDNNGDFAIHENGVGDRFLVKERGGIEVKANDKYAIRTSTTSRAIIEVKNTNDPGGGWWLANDPNGNFALHQNNTGDRMTIQGDGNVGIGTSTPDAKLTVKGEIHAERVKVDLNIPAPDYVFEEDYDLRSLEETANYIEENKHLPEVPSAEELEANGVDLVEMNMLLLKKMEEMTLHMIEQNKKIEALDNVNIEQEGKILKLQEILKKEKI